MSSRIRQALSGAALAAALAGPAAAAGPCCAPEVAVSQVWPIAATPEPRLNWQELRWVGTDGRGGVYALGRRRAAEGGYEHFLALSHDDGESWDPRSPLILGAPGKLYARAAVSADGHLVIVFSDGELVSAIRSDDQGRSFSSPFVLGAIEDYAVPRIAMADDGRTLVAWRFESGEALQVRAAVSADHGASWSELRVVHEGGPGLGLSQPGVLVTTGAVVVSWSEELLSPVGQVLDRAFTAGSIDAGESWFDPVRVSPAENTTGWLALATSSLNDVQALYAVRLTPEEVELRVNSSFNAGFSWPAGDEAVSPPLRDGGGNLFSWPDGSSWVVWFERDDEDVPDVGAIVARRSSLHGRPGTWEPAHRLAEGGLEQHHYRLSQGPSGVVDLLHDDYRDRADCPFDPNVVECESVFLDHSCDRGRSWLPEELRLDRDQAPSSPHSEDVEIARSPSGRLHAFFTNNSSAASELEDELVHVGLDPVGPTPEFGVEASDAEACRGSRHLFELVGASVDWCPEPEHQWFVDDLAVPGADAELFELPPGLPAGEHEVRYELRCGGSVSCRLRSEPVTVLVVPGEGSLDPGASITGPLLVARDPDGERLALSFTDLPPEASGYNLTSGSLQALHVGRDYDHGAALCHHERPAGATRFELLVRSPSEDAYFLVAPADCDTEGSVGTDSFGRARPLAPSGACGAMPD